MKRNLFLGLMAALVMGGCQKGQPLPEEMKPLFPEGATAMVEKGLYTVMDADKGVVGYALYSKPASDGIKGFKGETPLLIAFDNGKKITGVVMLPNEETPNFAKKVMEGGLLESWNGLSAPEAYKKECDAVSGATYTSKGVANTMKKALEAYAEKGI